MTFPNLHLDAISRFESKPIELDPTSELKQKSAKKREREVSEIFVTSQKSEEKKRARLSNPYQTLSLFLKYIDTKEVTNFQEERIDDFFLDVCGVSQLENMTIEILKKTFSETEIIAIISLLDWYHLLTMGFLPAYSDHKGVMAELKKFLNINSCIEILDPGCLDPEFDDNPLPFNRLMTILNSPSHSIEKTPYSRFIKLLGEVFSDHITPEFILMDADFLFKIYKGKKLIDFYKNSFALMDVSLRLRWGLFLAIAAYHLSDHNRKFGLTSTSAACFTSISSDLLPLIYKINKYLKKMLLRL